MTATHSQSPGQRLRAAVAAECPLQVVGAINALCGLMAERAGFRALYLSGAGVANASHGLPDLGVTTLQDVVEDARRITSATELPLLVDVDTGWGSRESIERTVRELIRVHVAGMQIEDQIDAKRCGHRPGKQLVDSPAMVERLQAAVNARSDPAFVIMARTDAAAVEGVEAAIERASKYVHAGADMIFAEALSTLEEYQRFTSAMAVPVLANITEFGRTPMFSLDELRGAGVQLVLYPLTAFRAMNAAATRAYQAIRQNGSQRELLGSLQTRDDLYDLLDYYAKEYAQEASTEE